MQNFKIKSYCKINLSLKVLKKLKTGYHNIASLITFCDLHDVISISEIEGFKDKISFSGKFKRGINKKRNTITKTLILLRKKGLINKKFFKIIITKNIPHGSGLGGGSSNAADLLNHLNLNKKLKLSKKKLKMLAQKIGFDVPISLEKKNTFLNGKSGKISRLKKRFKLNLLIVYPNVKCSTRKIYKENKIFSLLNLKSYSRIKNNKQLIDLLKEDNNDLQRIVIKFYPKIKKIIDLIKMQKGCYFSRITGSGSACIGIFSNMKSAVYAHKLIKLKHPKYWCAISKTI